jgi:hypothetical protein
MQATTIILIKVSFEPTRRIQTSAKMTRSPQKGSSLVPEDVFRKPSVTKSVEVSGRALRAALF